jgi:hypothetical protein
MLWTIFVMLLILWLLGLISSYTLGGHSHPSRDRSGGAGYKLSDRQKRGGLTEAIVR